MVMRPSVTPSPLEIAADESRAMGIGSRFLRLDQGQHDSSLSVRWKCRKVTAPSLHDAVRCLWGCRIAALVMFAQLRSSSTVEHTRMPSWAKAELLRVERTRAHCAPWSTLTTDRRQATG